MFIGGNGIFFWWQKLLTTLNPGFGRVYGGVSLAIRNPHEEEGRSGGEVACQKAEHPRQR